MDSKSMADFLKLTNRETYGFPVTHTVYDVEGVPLKLGTLDGKLVPPFGEKFFRNIRTIPLRDDDVILCGYPKTGCHWTWEILSMIVNRNAEYSKHGKGMCFLEIVPPELVENTPSPRVLNTHLWFDYLPEQVFEKKTKIVYTVRNPKDTAVSYYNHHLSMFFMQGYNGSFKNWFELYMSGQVDYGSYFDFHVDWDKAIKKNPELQILIVSFEDMKENLPHEIRKMSQFLNVSLDDQLVEDIAKAAGFETMKKHFAEKDLFSVKLLRKGQVGDWKNVLTVAQDECVDAAVEKLKGTCFHKYLRYTI